MDTGNMINDIKKYIIWPDENGLKEIEKKEFMGAVTYAVIGIIITSILNSVAIMALVSTILSQSSGMNPSIIGISAGISIILGIIVLFVVSFIFSLVTKVIKPEIGYKDMFKLFAYTATPYYYIGWIPVIGIIGSLLMLINGIRGLKAIANHDSYVRTIGVFIVSIIVIAIITSVIEFVIRLLSTFAIVAALDSALSQVPK